MSETELRNLKIFLNFEEVRAVRNFSKIYDALVYLKTINFFDGDDNKSLEYIGAVTHSKKNTVLTRLSELYKFIGIFLAGANLTKNELKINFELLDRFKFDRTNKIFEYTFNQTENKIKKLPFTNDTFRNYETLYDYGIAHSFASQNYDLYLEMFNKKIDFSTLNFFTSILGILIESIQQKINGYSLETLANTFGDKIDYENIFRKFRDSDEMLYSYIMLLYNLYKAFTDFNEPKYYFNTRKFHKKILKHSTGSLNSDLYLMQINYCINQTNHGKKEFYDELFDIINEKLEFGIYEELKEINYPVNHFRDYVFIAIRLKKIEWVKNFVNKYSVYLPGEFKQDEINISSGLILMEEKKFRDALKYFSRVKKTNYIYYTDSSFYKIRCYYNLRMYEEGFEEIARLRRYIEYHDEIPALSKELFMDNTNDMTCIFRYASGEIKKSDVEYHFKKTRENRKNWISEMLNQAGISI
jgi:hypothetical protein